jgi:hypothetical protein
MVAESVKSVFERLRVILISSSYEVEPFELLHNEWTIASARAVPLVTASKYSIAFVFSYVEAIN